MRVRMSRGARARRSSIRGVQKPQPSRKKKHACVRACAYPKLRLIINLDWIASRRCLRSEVQIGPELAITSIIRGKEDIVE